MPLSALELQFFAAGSDCEHEAFTSADQAAASEPAHSRPASEFTASLKKEKTPQ